MVAAAPDAAPRLSRLFDAHRVLCPRCGWVLRDLYVGDGVLYKRCDRRVPDPAHADRSRACGQHSYLVGHPGGFVLATPITGAEFQHLTAGAYLRPADVYAQLGLIERRAVPRAA